MIDLETMELLERLNVLSKPLNKSYALIGNSTYLQLFACTQDDVIEMCCSTPKSVRRVLKTLLNSVPHEYANHNTRKE